MTFLQAEKKLVEIAGETYCALHFKRTIHKKKIIEEQCQVYIDGYSWYSGDTWEDAFDKLDRKLNPKKRPKGQNPVGRLKKRGAHV